MRTGVPPMQVRKDVTAIYHASKTGAEFVSSLFKAGYILTRGRGGKYVLGDKAGKISGLVRRVDGVKRKDLRQKFPDLKRVHLPSLDAVLKQFRHVRTDGKRLEHFRKATSIVRRPIHHVKPP